ncbi:MAG: hypothetical protein ABIK89_17300 [Planctomycetota bacterium]
MSSCSPKVIRPIKTLVLAGLVAWGVFAWWTIREARRAGAVLGDSLTAAWPEEGAPQSGTRRQLLDAAQNLQAGEFRAVVLNLGPARPPTSAEKIAAERFFAQSQALRKRFLAAASAAQAEETDGADVGVVRNALARAFAAAARNDASGVAAQVELAERALDEVGTAGGAGIFAGDAETVAALVRRIEPAFQLGRELLTEGQAAVEKLVARASWHFQAAEYRQAASLLRLAAGLLGVEPSGPVVAETPKWFAALAQSPRDSVADAEAGEAVELAEAMAASLSPSEAVTGLVERARRELAADRPAEAQWWASTALAAMGMTVEAVAR